MVNVFIFYGTLNMFDFFCSTGPTQKSLDMLWTRSTTSSATTRRKSKVLLLIVALKNKRFLKKPKRWRHLIWTFLSCFNVTLRKDCRFSFLFHVLTLQMNQKVKVFGCMMTNLLTTAVLLTSDGCFSRLVLCFLFMQLSAADRLLYL